MTSTAIWLERIQYRLSNMADQHNHGPQSQYLGAILDAQSRIGNLAATEARKIDRKRSRVSMMQQLSGNVPPSLWGIRDASGALIEIDAMHGSYYDTSRQAKASLVDYLEGVFASSGRDAMYDVSHDLRVAPVYASLQ
jgi:hypothetical protein